MAGLAQDYAIPQHIGAAELDVPHMVTLRPFAKKMDGSAVLAQSENAGAAASAFMMLPRQCLLLCPKRKFARSLRHICTSHRDLVST